QRTSHETCGSEVSEQSHPRHTHTQTHTHTDSHTDTHTCTHTHTHTHTPNLSDYCRIKTCPSPDWHDIQTVIWVSRLELCGEVLMSNLFTRTFSLRLAKVVIHTHAHTETRTHKQHE